MPKGLLYQHLIDNFCVQFYLNKPIELRYRKYLTKFRISSHSLNIEKGRNIGAERNDRHCTKCNLASIEDKISFYSGMFILYGTEM